MGHAGISSFISVSINIFISSACSGSLNTACNSFWCAACKTGYGSDDGIPLLFWPNEWEDSKTDITDTIRAFYEGSPFPNYDDLDSGWSLRQRAGKGIFARLLDDQIPYGTRILEVGCGSGQLSNFLGMAAGRKVFATDLCLNSLKLGQKFKEQNQIANVAFLQMNLFRPV